MYGAIFALIITAVMIALVIYKAHICGSHCLICKKSELASIIDTLPDDTIIWIGRKLYEHSGADNS